MMVRARTEELDAVYMQVETSRPADHVRQSLERRLKVLECGHSPASNPEAVWFEVTRQTPQEPLPALHDVLGLLLPTERLGRFQKVTRGSGAGLARQLDMFGGPA